MISILMPYAAESFPVRQRGRATGWVAGCSKVGGVMAQGLAALALVPAFGLAAGAIAIPTVASLLLITAFGPETKGRDLRELEVEVSDTRGLMTGCRNVSSKHGLHFSAVSVTFHCRPAKVRV